MQSHHPPLAPASHHTYTEEHGLPRSDFSQNGDFFKQKPLFALFFIVPH